MLAPNTPAAPPRRRLTMREVCDRYGMSRGGIYTNVERGTFPKPLKIGTSLRWRLEDLDAFEAKQMADDEV